MPWRHLVGVDVQLCWFITLGLEVSGQLHCLATRTLRKNPSTLWIAGLVWIFWERLGSLAPAGVWTLYHPVCDLLTILTTLSCLLLIILWVIVSSLIIIRLLKMEVAFCYLNCGLKVCGTVMKTELLETYYVIIFQLTKWDVTHYQKCNCILFSGGLTNMQTKLTTERPTRLAQHFSGNIFPILRSVRLIFYSVWYPVVVVGRGSASGNVAQ